MTKRPTSVVIDPVAMGITNKIAHGSNFSGVNSVNGGLLIEGHCEGQMIIHGPLVLMEGATLLGEVEVNGDAYIFGQVGTKDASDTVLTVRGELHLTTKCVVFGRMRYAKIAVYQGSTIQGGIESLAEES